MAPGWFSSSKTTHIHQDNSHLAAQANARAEQARSRARIAVAKAQAAAEEAKAKANAEATKFAAKLAKEAKEAELNAQRQIREAELLHEKQQSKAKREEAADLRAFQERQAREKVEAEKRRQQADIEHKERMQQLENEDKEKKRQRIDASINDLNIKAESTANSLILINKELATAEEEKALYSAEKARLMAQITNFDTVKKERLQDWALQNGLDIARKNYERDRKEVEDAIKKTGVHSDDVGKFLMLTHAMTGATMSTQAQANRLDVALGTFGTIINNECQDQLTIEYYFQELNLEVFTPILAKDGFETLQHMICDDEKQFEKDILKKMDRGIEKQEKKQKEEAEKAIDENEKLKSEQKLKLQEIENALNKLGDFDETKEPEKENERQKLIADQSIIDTNIKMYESLLRKHKEILDELKYKAEWREEQKIERDEEEKSQDCDEDDEKLIDIDKEGEELCLYLLQKWKLKEFWAKLEEEGWDDADDWTTLTEEDLENDIGITKKGKRKKFMKQAQKWKEMRDKQENAKDEKERQKQLAKNKPKPKAFDYLTSIQQRELKRICLKPDTWEKFEKQKTKIIKKDLAQLCPVLGEFFGRIDQGIKQTGELLNYQNVLSDSQRNAIQMKDANNNKLKAIELKKKDYDGRRLFVQNSECEIYSSSSKQWCKGKVLDIKEDADGMWLTIEYYVNEERRTKDVQRYNNEIRPLAIMDEKESIDDDEKRNVNLALPVIKKGAASEIVLQSNALITASIVNVNVTDSLIQQFTATPVTERGLTLAIGVEDCCRHIIQNQGEIRQSVFLAQEILKYKPANMSDKRTVQLWKAVDAGIIRIFQAALEMVKVAAQYFGFFIRFQNSFKFFISCYSDDEDVSLLISLERLKKDVREFNKFRENFSNTVVQLNKTAMECIGNCVKQQIGHKNWEKSRNSVERTEKIYLAKQKLHTQESLRLDDELDRIEENKILEISKEARASEQCKILNARTQQSKDYLKQCRDQINDLQKIVI